MALTANKELRKKQVVHSFAGQPEKHAAMKPINKPKQKTAC